MGLDRDVLEVILLANRISTEKEQAKLKSKSESVKQVIARGAVQDIIKRMVKDLEMVSSMLVRGGYCAPELRDKAISTTVDYLNDRGQYVRVFPYEFVARRITTDLGFVGPDHTKMLAEYVSEMLEKMGYKQLKAKTRYGDYNAYIVTT